MTKPSDVFVQLPEGHYHAEAWLVDGWRIFVNQNIRERIQCSVSGDREIPADWRPILFSKELKDSVYKGSATLVDVLKDGWSRGFKFEQVSREAAGQGFLITKELIELVFEAMDARMEKVLEASAQSLAVPEPPMRD